MMTFESYHLQLLLQHFFNFLIFFFLLYLEPSVKILLWLGKEEDSSRNNCLYCCGLVSDFF